MNKIKKINDFPIKKICDNHERKKMQTYFAVSELLLRNWLQQESQKNSIVPAQKLLQSQDLPQKLPNFSAKEEDEFFALAGKNPNKCIISERLWGIRCGITHVFDPHCCSFDEVIAAARTDQMIDIYSPGIMSYYEDGHRVFEESYLAAYNTACNLGCYVLINKRKALNLFPSHKQELKTLPENTMFLTDPDYKTLRIASQEKNEVGMSFDLTDALYNKKEFVLGNLRPTFAYLAQKIQAGETADLCDLSCKKKIHQSGDTIHFVYGGVFDIKNALIVVSNNDEHALKQDYVKNSKKEFLVSFDGKYLKPNKKDIVIHASYNIYRKWGTPLTDDELKKINNPHNFEWSNINYACPKDIKINRLRLTTFELKTILMFSPNIKGIIEKNQIKELAQAQKRAQTQTDLSGPSRSSLMTGWYEND